MAAKETVANIIIKGKVDNSVYTMGNVLESLGYRVNGISQKIIQFGKESVEVYRGYEDNMLDARGALAATYDNMSKLNSVMDRLEKNASEWSANTIFHTDDVSRAISEAAHAGWTYEQMLEGIPAAMRLAQAGGIELSQGLDYIIKSVNSTGSSFSQLNTIVDQWAYASSRTATNIDEVGEAFMSLGASAQFADSTAELFTMIGILANVGTTGSEAGTMLRSSMMRIVAPTTKATKAMEALGASEEEINELAQNKNLQEAGDLLEKYGFSAYKAGGEMKGMLQTFADLYKATSGMTEEEQNKVLSSIFSTRTISGAKAMLAAAADNYGGLYEDIANKSAGYAQQYADTMMSGVTGTIELLKSQYEELQRSVGGILSEQVNSVGGTLTGLLGQINSMDEGKMRAVVKMAEGVALAGPALLGIGGAAKLIGALASPGGMIAAATTMIFGLTGAIIELNDQEYKSQFGDMTADLTGLQESLAGMTSAYEEQQANITKYSAAVQGAVSDYETATSELSSGLASVILAGGTITPEQEKEFMSLGSRIGGDLRNGIKAGFSQSMETVALYSGMTAEEAAQDEGIFGDIMATLVSGYEASTAKAAELSAALREAMTGAFDDGQLTTEERANIMRIMNEQNQLIASQLSAQNQASAEVNLMKAQRLGLASKDEAMALISEAENSMIANEDAALEQALTQLYQSAEITGLSPEETKLQADALMAGHAERVQGIQAQTAGRKNDLYKMLISDSFSGTFWDAAQEYALTGKINHENVTAFVKETGGEYRNYAGMYGAIGEWVKSLGGRDSVLALARSAYASGDMETAQDMLALYNAYDMTQFSESATGLHQFGGGWGMTMREMLGMKSMESFTNEANAMRQFANTYKNTAVQTIGSALLRLREMSAPKAQTESQADATTRAILEYASRGADFREISVNDEKSSSSVLNDAVEQLVLLQAAGEIPAAPITVQTRVKMTPDASAVQKEINNLDGQIIMLGIHPAFTSSPSTTGTSFETIENGIPYTDNTFRWYAEGGRADSPSIFGEAGPEWAIPEEHTQRTADLLAAAAEASGFGSGSGKTLVYAPVIYANDASGVEDVLEKDKQRMEDWFRMRKLRDEVGVYA